jgi:hypothetical protein
MQEQQQGPSLRRGVLKPAPHHYLLNSISQVKNLALKLSLGPAVSVRLESPTRCSCLPVWLVCKLSMTYACRSFPVGTDSLLCLLAATACICECLRPCLPSLLHVLTSLVACCCTRRWPTQKACAYMAPLEVSTSACAGRGLTRCAAPCTLHYAQQNTCNGGKCGWGRGQGKGRVVVGSEGCSEGHSTG